jgi:hypothetical protein
MASDLIFNIQNGSGLHCHAIIIQIKEVINDLTVCLMAMQTK